MEIIGYALLFFVVGFAITKILRENKKIIITIIAIAILWGIMYHPMWGLVSLGEMAMGYFVVRFNED